MTKTHTVELDNKQLLFIHWGLSIAWELAQDEETLDYTEELMDYLPEPEIDDIEEEDSE